MTERSVALIDDNKALVDSIANLLTLKTNFVIVGTAHDGLSGIELIKRTRPDIIILDIIMPRYDGIYILEDLNSIEPGYKPIIIVYSAISDDETIQKILSFNVNIYLTKPFDVNLLIKRVSMLCDLSEPRKPEEVSSSPSYPQEEIYYKEATMILKNMGVPPHLNGYNYLRTAIVLVSCDFNSLKNMKLNIYQKLAELSNSTPTRVERAMRTAIESAWNRCRVETIEEIFGNSIHMDKDKPSNGEFIARIADNIRLKHSYVRY